jgi:hypothetical protein
MSQITQRGATGPLAIYAGGSFQSSTDLNLGTLTGTRWDLEDGREVILVSTDSATTTVAGKLYQDAALIANHQSLVTTAFTAYSSNGNTPASVSLTLGGTLTTVNQYQGGFAVVTSGAGLGQTLIIAGNTAQANTVGTVVVTLEDNPGVALDTSSRVSLVPSHGSNVIIGPTTITNVPCGIALYAIAVSSFGFLLTKGITAALSDVSVAGVGQSISPSITTAGATTLSGGTAAVIGYTAIAAVSAQTKPVFLNI